MTTFPKSPSTLDLNAIPNQSPDLRLPAQVSASTSVQSISYVETKAPVNDSPIFKLLEKQKKNMVDVSIQLKINLPSKDLYNVLIESFEGAEDEVIDYIINGIEVDDIKKSLSESIKKSYYSKPETPKAQTLKSKKAELENQ
jgi:hypothetical protein